MFRIDITLHFGVILQYKIQLGRQQQHNSKIEIQCPTIIHDKNIPSYHSVQWLTFSKDL